MDAQQQQKIPKRILSSLINSISAGVVPRTGAPYLAIGRTDEIAALLNDLEVINDNGSSMRFLIGKYGSGKSFLMQLIRGYAMERGFITADADLSPERRICGSKGTGIATYRELMKNLSSKASPEGGALPQLIAKWISTLQGEVAAMGFAPDDPKFTLELNAKVYSVVSELEGQIGGFDFATVVSTYRTAYVNGDDETKSACMRWLRGEYETKTEARKFLKVGSIIDDDNWYDFIKLFAVFVRKTGSRGLFVFIDECVNLYKISNRISRENNYEKLLSMFNDTLQGRAPGLGLILGGTPQFLEDNRRGLFSYEALRSRLVDGKFNNEGFKNFIGPVIRLRRLSDDELFALIARVTKLHAQNYEWTPRVSTSEMTDFLKLCLSRAGADTLITPREIIRDYMSVLNILYQNKDATFEKVVGSGVVTLKHDNVDDDQILPPEDENVTIEIKPVTASVEPINAEPAEIEF
ncbi:MAG: ATP-binding protein [Oscillospiraceae bacterium]|nr:ATP-binding protein [Oscillospiraceae bacterium]